MKLKVMTYNIQHGLDYEKRIKGIRYIDLKKIAKVIKDINPDIVCLNEVYNTNLDNLSYQTKDIASILGYKYFYFGKAITINNKEYGNAVISKYPFKKIETISIPDPIIKDEDCYYESRCIIKLSLDIPCRNNIFVSHFGLSKKEQENAVNVLLDNIDKERNVIFMGDLNMTWDNPNIKRINSKLKEVLIEKEGINYTFPSINPSAKIDYIFASFDSEVIDSGVIRKVASDHFPCYAIINIKED